MAISSLLGEKPTRSLTEFDFLQDPKDKKNRLGIGSFATVKLAREKKTGKLVAMKIVNLGTSKSRASDLHNLKIEINVHKRIDHPNIIKYYGYTTEDAIIYIALDFADKGNLYSYIHRSKSLTKDEIFRFFYQTCLAVQYLHTQDIMHRDLKPENLLLDKDLNIKLCDFGWSAERIKDKRTTFCGTYEYMAPEIVHKKSYDYRIDVWSLGVLLYELIHKEAPYKGRSLSEIWKSLAKGTISFSLSTDPQAKDLILRILKVDPNERPSISQILSHPWVKQQLEGKEYLTYVPMKPKYEKSAEKENHSAHFAMPEKHEKPEKPTFVADNTYKKAQKPSSLQSIGSEQSGISRRGIREEQSSDSTVHTHKKASYSVAKTMFELSDTDDKKILGDLYRKRKMQENKTPSSNQKRSLHFVANSINHTPSIEPGFNEVTSTASTSGNASQRVENHSAQANNTSINGIPHSLGISAVAGTFNSHSSAHNLRSPIMIGSAGTMGRINFPTNDNSRAFGSSQRFRTLTSTNTPTSVYTPSVFNAPQTAGITSSRPISHQKTLTVINESEVPRRLIIEPQTTAAHSHSMSKGSRCLISPRYLDGASSDFENNNGSGNVGGLVSPVTWSRKLVARNKAEDVNAKEENVLRSHQNLHNESSGSQMNRGERSHDEERGNFGISFNRFLKGGDYKTKLVYRAMENSGTMKVFGSLIKEKKTGNKENKTEGENKRRTPTSLERLHTPRGFNFRMNNN